MIPWRIERTIDLTLWQRGTERLGALMYTGSSKGHRLELRMLDSGQAVQIDGDARADFMHYTNGKAESMVSVAGTVKDNLIAVEFPAEAYQTGQNVVIVWTEKQGVSVPVYAGSYHVQEGEAEVVIDPEDIVPNLSEILAQISAVRAATADAVNATNTANRNEQARATAEKQRVQNENARVTNENSRATAENQRAQSESGRVAAEKNRVTAEKQRVQSESARATAEQSRATAESSRAKAEEQRVSVEQARATGESSRIKAENARVEAENGRVTAETARVKEHAATQEESKEQAQRAKEAADKLSEFAVEVESLPPSADPTAQVTQTATKTTVALGIPTSNFAYATFYIDPKTRQLVMRMPNGFSAIQFAIKDRRLVVRINGE